MNKTRLPHLFRSQPGYQVLLILTVWTIQTYSQTTLFKNFIICDGTGNKVYNGDVRIRGQHIALIGTLIPQYGETVIEGDHRLILAPGFIDTHSHHDRNLEDSNQFNSFFKPGNYYSCHWAGRLIPPPCTNLF